MLDQIPFFTFSKLSFFVPNPPGGLFFCGALEFYDKSFNRLNPKNDHRLERFKFRNFFEVTTTDDRVIRRFANEEDKTVVFATDSILSTLRCAPRSVYSCDIVIHHIGNKHFFHKRNGSEFDLNFSQQVLRDGNKVVFDEPNLFALEREETAFVAYRYRRWKIDQDTYLIARCEVHSVVDVRGQQKLETKRGVVLATELKNNANKLAKWTAQALHAEADLMKIGYVSRVHPRDHFNHVILSAIGHKKKDFAAQINLNTSNMRGIVKSIVDLCMKLNEGENRADGEAIDVEVGVGEDDANKDASDSIA
ncbi:Eukaryotic translation initiation factor 3 subunit D [Platanthera zijinensis]|uniref:Eukaryotic translation initiation factor 3 subunit D n=1 Tax=Platanthera zijinensis TaxID=2320716 RepID=A0AAP0G0N6_9ASPA